MGESNIVLFSIKGNDLPLAKNIAVLRILLQIPSQRNVISVKKLRPNSIHLANRLNISLGEMNCGAFSNKETKLSIGTSVRNKDVFVLQVLEGEPNDCVMELLMMCYALKSACCRKVVGVVPYLPYSKQSKMRNRGSITAKLLATLLSRAGMDHMLTLDLHSKEVQGFYDCPVDNLRASPFLIQYLQERVSGYQDAVIVARHPGAAARANAFAERLQLNIAVLHGEHVQEDSDKCDGRQSPPALRKRVRGISDGGGEMHVLIGDFDNRLGDYNRPIGMPAKVKKMLTVVGDVTNRIAIIVEDIVDDATMLADAATILKNGGALGVYVVATHGLFSGNAQKLIMDSKIDQVIVTNTVPVDNKIITCPKIQCVDVSSLLSEAVRRIHNGESMSYLFRNIHLED